MMLIAIGIFFVFLLLGMPVAFAIGLSGFSFFMMAELPMTILVQKSISASQSFTMLAIPLFILAGKIMEHGKMTYNKIDNLLKMLLMPAVKMAAELL